MSDFANYYIRNEAVITHYYRCVQEKPTDLLLFDYSTLAENMHSSKGWKLVVCGAVLAGARAVPAPVITSAPVPGVEMLARRQGLDAYVHPHITNGFLC